MNNFNMVRGINYDESLRINKLILTPTIIPYCDVHNRGYTLRGYSKQDLDRAVEMLLDRCFQEGGRLRVTEQDVSTALNGVFSIKASSEGVAAIPYGWNAPRFKFVMIVVDDNSIGNEVYYIIQGFTDQDHLNYDTKFYFNSVISYTAVKETGAVSNTSSIRLLQDLDVNRSIVSNKDSTLKLMRPRDVYQSIINKYEQEAYNSSGEFSRYNLEPVNVAAYNNREASYSYRNNDDVIKYIASILNAYVDGKQSNFTGYERQDSIYSPKYDAAKNQLSDVYGTVQRNRFIRLLTEQISSSNEHRAVYEYRELAELFPNALRFELSGHQHVVNFIEPPMTDQLVHYDVDRLDGSDVLTAKMQMLSNSITSNLIDSGLRYVEVKVDIFPSQAVIEPRITKGRSLLGPHMTIACCDKFYPRIVNLLLYVFGEVPHPVSLDMTIDFCGDTVINYVDMGSNYRATFVFPTFADSTYSSVITSLNNKSSFCNDINMFLESRDEMSIAHTQPMLDRQMFN